MAETKVYPNLGNTYYNLQVDDKSEDVSKKEIKLEPEIKVELSTVETKVEPEIKVELSTVETKVEPKTEIKEAPKITKKGFNFKRCLLDEISCFCFLVGIVALLCIFIPVYFTWVTNYQNDFLIYTERDVNSTAIIIEVTACGTTDYPVACYEGSFVGRYYVPEKNTYFEFTYKVIYQREKGNVEDWMKKEYPVGSFRKMFCNRDHIEDCRYVIDSHDNDHRTWIAFLIIACFFIFIGLYMWFCYVYEYCRYGYVKNFENVGR
jgi:hypothetical protein